MYNIGIYIYIWDNNEYYLELNINPLNRNAIFG